MKLGLLKIAKWEMSPLSFQVSLVDHKCPVGKDTIKVGLIGLQSQQHPWVAFHIDNPLIHSAPISLQLREPLSSDQHLEWILFCSYSFNVFIFKDRVSGKHLNSAT